MKAKTMSVKKLLQVITQIIEDKKGKELTVIDLRKKSILCDYFMLVSATSKTHAEALSDNIHYELKKFKLYPKSIQGLREASWVILDYGIIVVHIFTDEKREFYNLEGLWKK